MFILPKKIIQFIMIHAKEQVELLITIHNNNTHVKKDIRTNGDIIKKFMYLVTSLSKIHFAYDFDNFPKIEDLA